MGLKDWLAKSVAGVSGYGEVMGREAVKNGVALGRRLYLGHGTRATANKVIVFEDAERLKSDGFKLYCDNPNQISPMEDTSELSKHTRACGIALAAQCAITASTSLMTAQNADTFCRSLGGAARAEVGQFDTGIGFDLIMHYLKLPRPQGVSQVLDFEHPGTNDLLSVFLREVSTHIPSGAVAFRRSGVLGYDVVAVPMADETVSSVRDATQKFGW